MIPLRTLRLARGWSQWELARRAGVRREQISRWECGWRSPDHLSVERLALGLGYAKWEDLYRELFTEPVIVSRRARHNVAPSAT